MAEPAPGGTPHRSWWRRLVEGPTEGERAAYDRAVTRGLREAAGERGWPVVEDGPELAGLLAAAPLRLRPEHLAAPVARGRVGGLDLLAADVRYRMPKGELAPPQYALTAAPLVLPVPTLRIAPRRFLSPAGGGLLVLPTGEDGFDARWRILVARDEPELRALSGPRLRAALLETADVDELWTGGGHVAVTRAGAHRADVLAVHVALLEAALTGLREAP